MCCGQFKNDFLKQVFVNSSLVNISGKVNEQLDNEGASMPFAKQFMHKELKRQEIKIKLMQQLYIAHAKYDDIDFKPDGTRHTDSSYNDEGFDSQLELNSRRLSGKGSSSGDDKGGTGSRRTSTKLRSDVSSQHQKYCFDEKAIEDYIKSSMDEIFSKVLFKIDEPDEGNDELGNNRSERYAQSPR